MDGYKLPPVMFNQEKRLHTCIKADNQKQMLA
jgi:hypothetical protein